MISLLFLMGCNPKEEAVKDLSFDAGTHIEMTKVGEATRVIPTDAAKSCQIDSDCFYIDTDCNDCCIYSAINAELVDPFEGERLELCSRDPKKISCECAPLKEKPKCVKSRCVLQ